MKKVFIRLFIISVISMILSGAFCVASIMTYDAQSRTEKLLNEIQENDNIIFDRNNKLIVKKVTKVENKNGTNNFFIEEDETISNEKLENAQIIGKVVSKAPGVGNVAMFIQSPIGTLNVLIIIVCIIIIIKKINKEILNSENNYTEENRKVDEEEDGKEECNKEE